MDYSIFEQLSSLSDEEFQALIDEYNYSKMITLPVEKQKYIKEKMKTEAFRRMNLVAHYEIGRENLVEKINNINEKITLLDKVTGGNYDAFPGISQDVIALKAELVELNKKLDLVDRKMQSNDNRIDGATQIVIKTRLSITKNRLDAGKKAVFVTAPQKICDLGKRLLGKIKCNVKKACEKSEELSKKTEEKFEDYQEKNAKSLAAIDDAMDNLMRGLQETEQMRGYEKYVAQNEYDKNLQTQKRKYEKVAKKAYIVSKLQPGIIRMVKLPSAIINKISNKQEVIEQRATMGM